MLGMQVEICRVLMAWQSSRGEAAPYSAFGRSTRSFETAVAKLVKAGHAKREPIKNVWTKGFRSGFQITAEGRVWYKEARELYRSLSNQPTTK